MKSNLTTIFRLFSVFALLAASLPAAKASTAFPSDISMSGQMVLLPGDIEFFAPLQGTTSTGSGTFFSRVSGVDTTGSFADEVITGSPVTGALTTHGDGVQGAGDGFGGTVAPTTMATSGLGYSAGGDKPVLFFIDTFLGAGGGSPLLIANSSVSVFYEIFFSLTYSHSVNAFGDDTVGESDLEVKVDGTEIINLEVISDTFFGNEINKLFFGEPGGPPTEFGGQVMDAGVETFSVIVAPGGGFTVGVDHTLSGEVYEELSSIAGSADFFLSVDDIAVVPEPSSALLILVSLAGVALRRTRR